MKKNLTNKEICIWKRWAIICTAFLFPVLLFSTFYFLPSAASAAARFHMPPNYLRVGASSLIGHWTFDGIDMSWSTNKALDKSASGNAVTITNMSTTTSPVKGKIGQALSFDGVNDYIDAGDINAMDGLSTLSVSGWFKFNTLGIDFQHIIDKRTGNDGWNFLTGGIFTGNRAGP